MNRVCHFCLRIQGLLSNPYHYSGAIVARLAVSVATIIWSVIVLLQTDALARWPGASVITRYIHEDAFAWFMMVISIMAIYRIVRQSKPIKLGACIYAVMALLWAYTFASLMVAIHYGETILRPGQVSAILAVTVLALFAFISNPKSHQGS